MNKAWLVFLALASGFFLLKVVTLSYSIGDENIYYYMGSLISGGKMPYSDFFYAHPPLQAFLFGFVFKLFGFSFLLLKLSSTIAALVTSFFLFKLLKDRLGPFEASAGTALMLFSYDFLRFTSHPTGAALTAMFLFIGFYFFACKRFLLSGLFIGLAGLTGLYALIGAAVIFVYAFLRERAGLRRLVAGFALTFMLVNLVFLLVFKGNFLSQVYLYHLLKPADSSAKLPVFFRLLEVNALLFFSSALVLLAAKRIKAFVFVSLALVLVYVAFFVLLSKVFAYYFVLIFPFLALVGAYSFFAVARSYRLKQYAFAASFLVLFLPSAAWSINKFVGYDYQDFDQADEIAAYVRENSLPNQTIFGDDSSTGLVALLSGRGITNDFVDTNSLRFRSGMADIGEAIGMLKSSDNRFVLAYSLDVGRGELLYGMLFIDEFSSYLNSSCSVAKEFSKEWNTYTKKFTLYTCEQS